MAQLRCGHGTVAVQSWYNHNAVKVLSRYAHNSVVVRYAGGSFVPGILALHVSSLDMLLSSLPSGCCRSLVLHEKLTNTDDVGSNPFFG